MRLFSLLILLLIVLWGLPVADAYDQSRCSAANSRASSTNSAYSAARSAYDYCIRYGDTSGSGYGSKDCNSAYSTMQSAKSAYDAAVSEQWHYCY